MAHPVVVALFGCFGFHFIFWISIDNSAIDSVVGVDVLLNTCVQLVFMCLDVFVDLDEFLIKIIGINFVFDFNSTLLLRQKC